jgi:hypothetical protein
MQHEFHPKYVTQAKVLADPATGVAGTAYERYFSLQYDFAFLHSLPPVKDLTPNEARSVAGEFYRLCKIRSEQQLGSYARTYTIDAGATIEQAALLTSHNYHMLLLVSAHACTDSVHLLRVVT